MLSKSLKRAGSVVAAAALIVAGATIANAENVGTGDIRADETEYKGWHQGATGGAASFAVEWDGLHLGYNGPAQVINGLGEHGDVYPAIDQDDLNALITSAETEIVDGQVWQQLAFFYGGDELGGVQPTNAEFTTLRPSAGDTAGTATFSLDDTWTTSGAIGTDFASSESAPLSDLLDAIYEEGGDTGVALLSYGVYAEDSAKVASITWGGETTTFSYGIDSIADAGSETVAVTDIRPNEATYPGWHEGYLTGDEEDADATFAPVCEGIEFGAADAPSQILNGFAEEDFIDIDGEVWPDDLFAQLAGLITSADIDVVDGSVYFQLPMFIGSSDPDFTTLRPATPGSGNYSLDDEWISSNDIGYGAEIPANTPIVLGDLLQALAQVDASVQVIGYGMLSYDGPSTVSNVTFNGLTTTFAGLECEPLTPLEPSNPVEEEPTTPPTDDDETPAPPVVREPAYTG